MKSEIFRCESRTVRCESSIDRKSVYNFATTVDVLYDIVGASDNTGGTGEGGEEGRADAAPIGPFVEESVVANGRG